MITLSRASLRPVPARPGADGLPWPRAEAGGRIQNRLAHVRLVGDDRLAALERDGLAKQPLKHRPAPLRVRSMACVARQVGEQLFTGRRQRSFRRAAAQPRLIFVGIHHNDFADHS